MRIIERNMDIFKSDKNVLVHCVSEDCVMGAGIALEFNKRFPRMRQIVRGLLAYNNLSYPTAVEYKEIDTNLGLVSVINMVTKGKYYEKPTYNTLKVSLEKVKEICLVNNYKEITIPRIGCGLDRLNWYKVRNIIECVFQDTDIDILVCVKED